MRAALLAVVVLAARGAGAAPAETVVDELVAQALAVRPELGAASDRARAERERVAQAEALPDPVLSLGIQNDGFDGIAIGTAETSWFSIELTQDLPWPGKRALRGRVAALGADRAQVGVARARLSTEAEVRRAYLQLQLVRDRLALLAKLSELWQRSQDLARARYEVASAPQSDILRAQLERTRLAERRLALEADERTWVHELNHLRAHDLHEAIATPGSVRDLAEPLALPEAEELADAEARSPELAAARIGTQRADAVVDLARKEQFPDFAVTAGIMPRGGLEPMWAASVSVTLPFLWGRSRHTAAVAQAAAERDAERQDSAAVAHTLQRRVAERRARLEQLKETLRLYRDGLLVQSSATVESTLAQYRVGKLTFASVLEAVAGYIADEDAYLAVLADAQRIAIARAEDSLEPLPAVGGGGRM
jgi:outer membrane protein TolC